MKKRTYFDVFDGPGWPEPRQLEHYFVARSDRALSFAMENDSGALHVEGLYGTDGLTPKTGRVDVSLYFTRHPDHGVIFSYSRWDGRTQTKYELSSKGDMHRLREWARSMHGTALPVGLFVPFPSAWNALKEFLQTDGECPKAIAWVPDAELPPDTFPR